MRSYLKSRKQFEKIEIECDCLDVVCGEPQGSELGPVLLNLCISDISKLSNALKCVLFADDTNILVSGENLQLLSIVTTEISKLNK